jgi:hypothetical protein
MLGIFWSFSLIAGAISVVFGQLVAQSLRGVLPPEPTATVLTVAGVVGAGLVHERLLSSVSAWLRRSPVTAGRTTTSR